MLRNKGMLINQTLVGTDITSSSGRLGVIAISEWVSKSRPWWYYSVDVEPTIGE